MLLKVDLVELSLYLYTMDSSSILHWTPSHPSLYTTSPQPLNLTLSQKSRGENHWPIKCLICSAILTSINVLIEATFPAVLIFPSTLKLLKWRLEVSLIMPFERLVSPMYCLLVYVIVAAHKYVFKPQLTNTAKHSWCQSVKYTKSRMEQVAPYARSFLRRNMSNTENKGAPSGWIWTIIATTMRRDY